MAATNRKVHTMAKITVNDLLEAGCHFGHQTKRWNPKMKKFVYGARNGISIIDLTKTIRQIADACNFLQNVVGKGGEILFVGTKRQAQDITRELAEATDMPYVAERWMGGTLTNNVTIRKSISKMYELDKLLQSEQAQSYKRKEIASMTRNSKRLHRDLDGIASMKHLPAALVVLDVCHDAIAVAEAHKLNIPIVAICDTNADPEPIAYPVAANDDAVKSIRIITDLFRDSILVAREIYRKNMAAEAEAKAEAERIAQEEAADAAEQAPAEKSAAKKPGRPRKTAAAKSTKAKAEAEAKPEAPAEAAAEAPAAE